MLEAGSELTAEFRADQLDDLNSFQFALHFDPGQLELAQIEPLDGLPVSMDNFGTFNLAEGEIRTVWAQATSVQLDQSAPMFRLRFKVLRSGARLSAVLKLNDEALAGHCYNSAYQESGVALRYSESAGTDAGSAWNTLLLQNRPNPFAGTTALLFTLPADTDAELRVSDAQGRVLFSQKKHYAAGRQEQAMQLDGACGMLLAELVTPFGTVWRKMIAQQ